MGQVVDLDYDDMARSAARHLDAVTNRPDTSSELVSLPSRSVDRSRAMPGWPYPTYADRRWLGGDRGPDKALAGVVRALRSLVSETGGRGGPPPPAPACLPA